MTHDQFLRMRDGYVTKSEITRRDIESHEQEQRKEQDALRRIVRKKRKGKRPPPMEIGYNELGIAEDRKVLYRQFIEISSIVYLVEIS